jgi:hypothetical protein
MRVAGTRNARANPLDTHATRLHFLFQQFAGMLGRDRILLFHVFFRSPSLVTVDDLDVGGVLVLPAKADTVLVVNPDTELSLSVAFEGFQPVAADVTKRFVVCKPEPFAWADAICLRAIPTENVLTLSPHTS